MSGSATVPPDAVAGRALRVVIEVRDVSLADAPSSIVAERVLAQVELEPGGQIPFDLSVPVAWPGQRLSLRVHVDRSGAGCVRSGDLLSVQNHPIETTNPAQDVIVPLSVV